MAFIVIHNGTVARFHREEEVQIAKKQRRALVLRECVENEPCYYMLTVEPRTVETAQKIEELALNLTSKLCAIVVKSTRQYIFFCLKDLYNYVIGVLPFAVSLEQRRVVPYSDDDKQLIVQAYVQTFAELAAKAVTMAFTILIDSSKLREAVKFSFALSNLARNANIDMPVLKRLGLPIETDIIMDKVESILKYAIEKVDRR
jgi:hypothetical protein